MKQIDLFRVLLSPDAKDRAARVLSYDENGRAYLGEGAVVREFERALDAAFQVPEPGFLAVNSCTSALYLALQACGVGPGSEVVTSAATCSLTTSAIVLRGARPVWADVDRLTGLIDPDDIAQKVSRRTKAIMVVSFAGRRPNFPAIRVRLANLKQYVPIIEDGAHLAPEPIRRPVEPDYLALSFQSIKFLTNSDGGALLTPHHERRRVRLMRWAGLDRESNESFRAQQNIQEVGGKFHLTDLAASVGLANLPLVPAAVARHRANAAFYDEALKGLPGITLPPPDPTCSYWLYVLLVDEAKSLQAFLAAKGIESSPVHRRNDEHDAYDFYNGPLPGLDWFAPRQLCIPTGWWVTDEDRECIAEAVRDWALHARG